jgi:hypothetical protein
MARPLDRSARSVAFGGPAPVYRGNFLLRKEHGDDAADRGHGEQCICQKEIFSS